MKCEVVNTVDDDDVEEGRWSCGSIHISLEFVIIELSLSDIMRPLWLIGSFC